jgi:hypothetical protein
MFTISAIFSIFSKFSISHFESFQRVQNSFSNVEHSYNIFFRNWSHRKIGDPKRENDFEFLLEAEILAPRVLQTK